MTPRGYLTFLGVFIAALACGSAESGSESAASTIAEQPTDGSLGRDVVEEGQYTFGHEVNIFAPCGTARTYWVVGEAAITESIRTAYVEWSRNVSADPFEPMFARFRGHLTGESADGFAAELDGLFFVENVLLLRGLQEGDCSPLSSPS
jgi:hypothetical protein